MLSTVEHTLGQLEGAKVFTKLDTNSGFWQIPLSKDSRLLTTFHPILGATVLNTYVSGFHLPWSIFKVGCHTC